MNVNALKIVVVSLFVIVSLQACSKPELPALQQGDVILAFGDSLTAGYGVKSQQSYPAVLESLSGYKVINAGISGETTQQGLERFESVLNQHQPGLVILFEGGNDVLQNVPVGMVYSNLKRMIQIAKQKNIAVMLVGVPEKKLFAGTLDLYGELATEMEVPLEEGTVASLMARPSMKSDYVHFNSKGYTELANSIYEILQQSGAL